MTTSNTRPLSISNLRKRPLITNIDRLPDKIALKNTRARESMESFDGKFEKSYSVTRPV